MSGSANLPRPSSGSLSGGASGAASSLEAGRRKVRRLLMQRMLRSCCSRSLQCHLYHHHFSALASSSQLVVCALKPHPSMTPTLEGAHSQQGDGVRTPTSLPCSLRSSSGRRRQRWPASGRLQGLLRPRQQPGRQQGPPTSLHRCSRRRRRQLHRWATLCSRRYRCSNVRTHPHLPKAHLSIQPSCRGRRRRPCSPPHHHSGRRPWDPCHLSPHPRPPKLFRHPGSSFCRSRLLQIRRHSRRWHQLSRRILRSRLCHPSNRSRRWSCSRRRFRHR